MIYNFTFTQLESVEQCLFLLSNECTVIKKIIIKNNYNKDFFYRGVTRHFIINT